MVLHVIYLKHLPIAVLRASVVKEIVDHIVTHVPEEDADFDGLGPILIYDHLEWRSDDDPHEYQAQDWWEDKSVPILWEGMMDAMNQEVDGIELGILGEVKVVLTVEEHSMNGVFE